MTSTTETLAPAPEAPVEEWIAWANSWRTFTALNMVCHGLDETGGTFSVESAPFPLNPGGAINGGILAAIADQVFGVLAMWRSPGFVPATANLHVEFHRPLVGPVAIRGEIQHGGRRLQFMEAVLSDLDGRRCVTARATMVSVRERTDL